MLWFCKHKALLRQRNAYEGNPDMFYKKTTGAKQRTFDAARFFLAESHIRGFEASIQVRYLVRTS